VKCVFSEGPLVIDEIKVAVFALTDPAGKSFVGDKSLNKVDLGVGVFPKLEVLGGEPVSGEVLGQGNGAVLEQVVVEGELGEEQVLGPGDPEISYLNLITCLEEEGKGFLVSNDSGGVGVVEVHLEGDDLKRDEVEVDVEPVVVENVHMEADSSVGEDLQAHCILDQGGGGEGGLVSSLVPEIEVVVVG
jgi:hypothetical protein